MRDLMAVLICVGLPAICGLASPPDNDNFADRRVLVGGAVQDVVGIAGATVEPGEPMRTNCFSRTESVWWTWTAPASGTVNIRASAYCSVWSGDSLTNLLFLGDHREEFGSCFIEGIGGNLIEVTGSPPPVRLDVCQGQELQISAAGLSGDTRLVHLNLDLSTVQIVEPTNGTSVLEGSSLAIRVSPPSPEIDGAITQLSFVLGYQTIQPQATGSLTAVVSNLPPGDYSVSARFTNGANRPITTATRVFHIRAANDDFAAARLINSLPLENSLRFNNASEEAGEPSLPGQLFPASLWWKWTASTSGQLWISSPLAALGVFIGERVDGLTLITNGISFLVVPVEAGTTYYFKAAPTNALGVILNVIGWDQNLIRFALRPPNDDFENRLSLVGSTVAGATDNWAATIQSGEPSQAGWRTLWWSWTAPAGGLVSLTVSPPLWTRVAVWQGDSITNLTVVTADELPFGPSFFPRLYQFEARQGETYQISMGNIYNWDYTGISFTLDLCTMHVLEPAPGADLIRSKTLPVRVSAPRADLEGAISPIVFRALRTATRAVIPWALSDYETHPSPLNPLIGVFTNLPAADYLIYAQATNRAGRLITTLTNLVHIHELRAGSRLPQGPLPFVSSVPRLGRTAIQSSLNTRRHPKEMESGTPLTKQALRVRAVEARPAGWIGPVQMSADRKQLDFHVVGQAGVPLTIETSYDLVSWVKYLAIMPCSADPVAIGPIPIGSGAQFFRIR